MAVGAHPLHPRHPSRAPLARPAPQGAPAARHRADRPRASTAPTRVSSARVPAPARAVSSGRRAFAVASGGRRLRTAVHGLLRRRPGRSSGASPTPTPTATVVAPEGQQAPAVTKAQAERILARIAATAAEATKPRDEALAATRLDGAVLASPRDQLRAARRDRRLRGAGRHPDQAARDRPAAGVRRLAALGDGRRRRRGDEDLEHHGAHAGGCLVAVQARRTRRASRRRP